MDDRKVLREGEKSSRKERKLQIGLILIERIQKVEKNLI